MDGYFDIPGARSGYAVPKASTFAKETASALAPLSQPRHDRSLQFSLQMQHQPGEIQMIPTFENLAVPAAKK